MLCETKRPTTVPVMSVHWATGHDLCPVGLMCCEITIDNSQLKNTFIECKKLQKELVTGLDMQLHCLPCDWTDNGQMFLHQGTNVFIS